MNHGLGTMTLITLALFAISCGNNHTVQSENMDTVYKKNGRPVKTRMISEETFVKSLTYIATLKGSRESSASALIADTVEAVMADVGDYVEKDQPVVLFPKSNPTANYYQAEAGYNAAKQAFDRIKNLYEKNGVSRQTFDDARTQYEVQLANWKNVQELVQINAPISGYITRLNVSPSNNVSPGTELFTVSNYDELTTTILANDKEIREFAEGQHVTAIWENETISGSVTQVDLSKSPKDKAFAVNVILENMNHSIPSGITATIVVDTAIKGNSIILHRKEFISNGDEQYVFVDETGIARKRIIKLGESQGMYRRVLSGLEAGDRIITEGINLVHDGEKIRDMNSTDYAVTRK